MSFYAVAEGRRVGIFKCHPKDYNQKLRKLTDHFSKNVHKKFEELDDAKEYMRKNGKTDQIVIDLTVTGEDNVPHIVICRVCNKKVGNDDSHPLCEGCKTWHHLRCINMKAEDVPDEEWFCDKCTIIKLNWVKMI